MNFNTETLIKISSMGYIWNNTGEAIFGIINAQTIDPSIPLTNNRTSYSVIILADGGHFLNSGWVTLAFDTGTTATMVIGSEVNSAAVAPGKLTAESVEFGNGAGKLVLNHTASDYVFDENISLGLKGDGVIDQRNGRTILKQDSSMFTGSTSVSGGQLQVNNNLGGIVDVLANGTLEGVGIGGSYNWDNDKYSIYGEASINTSLNNFGDTVPYKLNAGFRVKW